MISSSWDDPRRVAAAASVFTTVAVIIGVLSLADGTSAPQVRWPHTGPASAANTRPAHQDPCGRIVGPAEAYCERGTTKSAAAEQQDVTDAAWRLVPAGAGPADPMAWRCRSTAGQRRR
ncbi:hypothetical protein ACWCP6_28475 [Streptomyces sp. NPDC002004]